MSTGLTLWIGFFALWLYALRRATHRAFSLDSVRLPGIPFQPGPVSAATIVFHVGLSTALLVVLLASVLQDPQILWFGLPGLLATLVQGIVLVMDQDARPDARQTRRILPYWISEQWPFALLGLSVGIAGALWWTLGGTTYPLLLVGFSMYFLGAFRFYFRYHNEISVSPTTFQYIRSFPRLRTFTHRRPRTNGLQLRMKRRRRGFYDVEVSESSQPPIELTATLTSKERLQLELEEYFIRTEQA